MGKVVRVDETFEAEVATVERGDDEWLELTVAGIQVRVVDDPPQGALIMFARRADDKNGATKVASAVRLLEKWTHPDCHEALWEAIEDVQDVEHFLEHDLANFIEAVTSRPT